MASAGRRILRELKIKEISAVDYPAQVPARALILKRRAEAENGEETNMDPNELLARIAELEKSLARAEARSELDDSNRAYFNSLDEKDQDEFLTKSRDERTALVLESERKAKESEAVVYKSRSGELFRVRDDKRLVEMARKADELQAEIEKRDEQIRQSDLEKRAKVEFENLPGTVAQHCAILKALDGIADEETRTAAYSILKAKSDSIGKAMKSVGTSSAGTSTDGEEGVAEEDPLKELDRLAKNLSDKEKITFEVAYDRVLRTKEGAELAFKSRAVKVS